MPGYRRCTASLPGSSLTWSATPGFPCTVLRGSAAQDRVGVHMYGDTRDLSISTPLLADLYAFIAVQPAAAPSFRSVPATSPMGPLLDAALIGAVRKLEGAEAVSYETAIGMARALNMQDAAALLVQARADRGSDARHSAKSAGGNAGRGGGDLTGGSASPSHRSPSDGTAERKQPSPRNFATTSQIFYHCSIILMRNRIGPAKHSAAVVRCWALSVADVRG